MPDEERLLQLLPIKEGPFSTAEDVAFFLQQRNRLYQTEEQENTFSSQLDL